MADLLVVKIKHGNTLRRITISKAPEPLFSALDKKIRDLFQLAADAPLGVTYVDDEGDVVTLADDQDLRDAVVLQGLNPLRLTVKVEGSMSVSPSPSVLQSVPSVAESEVSGAQAKADTGGAKTAEEPKIEQDEIKGGQQQDSAKGVEKELRKAWSAAAAQAEVDANKIQEDIRKSLKAAWESARQNGAWKDDLSSVISAFDPLLAVAPAKLAEVVEAAMKSGFSATFTPSFETSDAYQASEKETPVAEHVPQKEQQQPTAGEASASSSTGNSAPECVHLPQPQAEEKNKGQGDSKPASADGGEASADRVSHTGVQCDACGMVPIIGPRYKSTVKSDYDLCRTCHAQYGAEGEYNKIERPLYRPRHLPFWANTGHPQGRMGIRPPCGPSFGPGGPGPCFGGRPFYMARGAGCNRAYEKAPEGKFDARFVKDVTIFDGTELAPLTPFTKIWRLRNNGTLPWPQHTRLIHVGGDHCGAESFVAVHVPEEGLMPEEEVEVSVDLVAPEKPGRYVSHWRLMAPGGRKFGHRVWSLIQVVPQDEPSPQLAESVADAAESFESQPAQQEVLEKEASAPPAPGVIQVTETPDLIDLTQLQSAPVAPAPGEVQLVESEEVALSATTPETVPEAPAPAPVVATPESPKVEDTSVGGFSLVEHPAPGEASIAVQSATTPQSVEVELEEPIQVEVEHGEEVSPVALEVPVFMVGQHSVEVPVEEEPVVVEAEVAAEEDKMTALLQQLEAMGFTDFELNVDLLKEHSFDLQRTLDELVAVSEWDPMLEELHEMGFYDDTVNRRLMRKNKGSVKRVVKDLVQMYVQQK